MSSVTMNGHDVKAGQIIQKLSLGCSGRYSFNPVGTFPELQEVTVSFVLSGMDGQTDRHDGFS